ncbi:TetR/AcrR family transcriptional regulator [Treponema phagedenis]|uniref:TetR/AcrR family transcriptional regulator n=1 Tax=Treponema phagedenis TaxID=162 RepID=A0A0B7GWC5_TREPH|nr:TetR/AcrR family transcriptional regulator [Treponema phagedenis]QEJ93952.1 TetR/AcrR family transcriptional regulator [Treponema phagedenis]QEJ96726.1 TetR/AcrR family transcriptional regulator [Treponema phagedenis]QEJ96797.1 TetR/AcrR family transcriptional regulator [Treponema phagedenis]QEJ96886.1 TetR/AcrR family transcriptional regulator [Treponema phagedenis]QEK02040.1 TetR/AcrR family transcriptional regulator [Treponema phagedenis]
MNIKNNKRKRASIEKIEKIFAQLLQKKEINKISVTEICKKAGINRTTFYANYLDIFDLAEKIGKKAIDDFNELYEEEVKSQYNSNDFLKLFSHIKENQLLYKTYFKLGIDSNFKIRRYDTKLAEKYYSNKYIDYHIEYFRAGITAIIKMWLNNNCDLEPEEVFQIIKEEYKNKFPS